MMRYVPIVLADGREWHGPERTTEAEALVTLAAMLASMPRPELAEAWVERRARVAVLVGPGWSYAPARA